MFSFCSLSSAIFCPCWHVGGRDGGAAMEFVDDLASRLSKRVQITTDGYKAYLDAIDTAFGGEVDYAMLVKLYGPSLEGPRRYSPAECTGAIKLIFNTSNHQDIDYKCQLALKKRLGTTFR
jgi:hypothetical protein